MASDESFIAKTFRKLVEKYENDKAAKGETDDSTLIDELVADLEAEGASYWYSSSAEC